MTPQRGDENFEALRNDKTRIPLPTKKDYQEANFNVACKMIQNFGYRPWMSGQTVVGSQGQRINKQGEIFLPNI